MGLEKYSLNFPPFFLTGRSSAYSRSPAGSPSAPGGGSCRDSSRSSWAARARVEVAQLSGYLQVGTLRQDTQGGPAGQGDQIDPPVPRVDADPLAACSGLPLRQGLHQQAPGSRGGEPPASRRRSGVSCSSRPPASHRRSPSWNRCGQQQRRRPAARAGRHTGTGPAHRPGPAAERCRGILRPPGPPRRWPHRAPLPAPRRPPSRSGRPG